MSDEKAPDQPSAEVTIFRPQTVMEFFGAIGPGVLATFDPKTPEGARMLIAATLSTLPSIKEAVNKEILIAHIYSNPASREGDTPGEMEEWRRIVLLDDKGRGYTCGSQGIGKSLGIIALCRGNPPWIPPVRCTVISEDIGKGRTWMKLVPDLTAFDAPAKRGSGR
jgi:hypothetical protein